MKVHTKLRVILEVKLKQNEILNNIYIYEYHINDTYVLHDENMFCNISWLKRRIIYYNIELYMTPLSYHIPVKIAKQ